MGLGRRLVGHLPVDEVELSGFAQSLLRAVVRRVPGTRALPRVPCRQEYPNHLRVKPSLGPVTDPGCGYDAFCPMVMSTHQFYPAAARWLRFGIAKP